MALRGVSAGEVALPARLKATSRPWLTTIGAYAALTKPRIMSLLLLTTFASALVAAGQHPLPTMTLWRIVLATMLGGSLASGGAAALNCYIDRDIDQVMARTRRRALPAGTLTPRRVLIFGLTLSVLSVVVLVSWTNPIAAGLALAGNLFYVVVYTMWLKRSTTQNIVIGGIAGAFPPVVGWSAVTGNVALPAILLFVLITYWTPAHFWSLALLLRGDYSRAGVPMLPSMATHGHARWQILVYTLLVVIASLLLYAVGAMGTIYLAAALILGAGFVVHAVLLYRSGTARLARRTFMYSNYYLAALFLVMIVDRLVR